MKTILLIGNGFKKLLAELVKSNPADKKPKGLKIDLSIVANNINDVAGLRERFKDAFPKIKRSHPYLCDEQILSLLDELSNEELFKEIIPINKIEELIGRVDLARRNSLREVAIDFKRFENIAGNKVIRSLFPHFGVAFENMLNNSKIEELFICTTNYDSILDTLLTYPERVNGSNFIFPDGFGWSDIKGHLKVHEQRLKVTKRCMVHLHGSYKFTRKDGNTYKLTGDIFNDEPVIVFNNPFLKEKEIYDDQVLTIYYNTLIEKLKTYDRVITIGNSFKNEPHIKNIIGEHFNRPNTELVICSLNPDEVAVELQNFYTQRIYQFTTQDVKNENQLFDLVHQLFMPSIMKSGSCINNKGLVA